MTKRRYIPMLATIEYLTGLSYPTLFALWLSMITLFGTFFAICTWIDPNHGLSGIDPEPSLYGFFSAVYFSVITTCTVGFGDIIPHGISRLFVSIESILALVGVGIFISKITSAREEVAFRQIHKLSFDTVFYQIRSELFILRRDFDQIIHEAKQGLVSEKAWQNLSTACFVCQALLDDIPDFYNDDNDLYTINKRREVLLLDAMQRTLRQTEALLRSLRDARWDSHEEARKHLKELLSTIDRLLPQWQQRSPHGHGAQFHELRNEAMRLHKELGM